jgi:uncharacterized protein (DUF1778 family)
MARKKTKPTTKDAEIKIRLTPEDKALFEDAARRRGLGVSGWLRMIALDVCEGRLIPKG